jgi:hypothetical protein
LIRGWVDLRVGLDTDYRKKESFASAGDRNSEDNKSIFAA